MFVALVTHVQQWQGRDDSSMVTWDAEWCSPWYKFDGGEWVTPYGVTAPYWKESRPNWAFGYAPRPIHCL